MSEIDPDLEPGTVVGEYVVDCKLGQGGFGAVFRAQHPLIGKVVAIKVLARKFSVDPEMVERFQQEAKAVNQIRHRHIIDIFSFGKLPDDGRSYYVMEYLDGETLDARIEREGRIPLAEAVPILRAIARALDAAHAKGIAHRDLKPENVFLARDPDGGDFPKLLDFGIAKLLRRDDSAKSKTRTGVPMGTPYYMSPEQCRGRDVDHRTDYYAFGIVAYQMLTGVFPLDGDDYMQILMKQMGEDPPAASTHNADLPPAVDDVLGWLMRKEPSERPPNLAKAIGALEQAAGMTVSNPTAPVIEAPKLSSSVQAQVGSLTTMPSPSQPRVAAAPSIVMAPPKRSRVPIVVFGVALIAAAAVVVFVLMNDRGDAKDEPPKPVATQQPAQPAPTPTPTATPTPTPMTPPAPAKPSVVTLTIKGAPDGTEVHAGGKFIGNPPTLQLERGDHEIVLTFEADGYRPTSRTVTPSDDATIDVKLERKLARPAVGTRPIQSSSSGQTPPTKDTLEDPFAHH